jgi:hypothetical protein
MLHTGSNHPNSVGNAASIVAPTSNGGQRSGTSQTTMLTFKVLWFVQAG